MQFVLEAVHGILAPIFIFFVQMAGIDLVLVFVVMLVVLVVMFVVLLLLVVVLILVEEYNCSAVKNVPTSYKICFTTLVKCCLCSFFLLRSIGIKIEVTWNSWTGKASHPTDTVIEPF